ncbi:hypothetical protein [Rubricoccus marinus]|uniref:Uncharacterized protein n=1 Tax=Rubricoccus marinus TaxID=716817 RepID=A0A259U172_9BACT|nr:hypothetical protein [Rubricoccus marinus]OZC03690.1 hypothetical protein BSZ36_12275 [Rubricoccus marinus]
MRRLALLLVLPLALTACDSGGEEEITSVRITNVTVDQIPENKPDGSDWDNAVGSGGPDVYVRVRLDGVDVATTRDREFGDLDQDELPQTLNIGGTISLNQLDRSLSFQVVDKDGGAASADDIMGTTAAVAVQSLVDGNVRVRSFQDTAAGVDLRVTFDYN